ncbi:MAG: SufD family Fe-S cluster assembly protein [Candidatus Caldarchaeum sp.]|uniref:SufD family Fe-S cluster assembly protein n=1 Tax=Caldiarchaeum subterraneum TaxID=311458 RepID=A0A7C5L7Y2_CALS0
MNSAGLILERFKPEPEWLTRLRQKFFEFFRFMPPETSELYVHHHEAPAFEESQVLSIIGDAEGREVPEEFRHVREDEEHATIVYVGNNLAHIQLPEEQARTGLEIMEFKQALKKHESFIRDKLENLTNSPYVDKYTSLTHALLNAGVFIRVPKSVRLAKPVRIIYILDKASEAVFTKTLIVCEHESNVSVVEELHGLPDSDGCVVGHHVELVLGDSGILRHAVLQNMAHNHQYMGNRLIEAGRHSSALTVGSLIGGGVSKVRVDSLMVGDGSSVNDLELVFGDGDQRMDLTANLHHIGFGTQGREVAKGVVKDKSRLIFKGMITVEKTAKNTNAYLAKHAMIMSPEARAYAIPSLEIKTDEVKATHSASVSQIDPEQIYYLMTRGIPYEEARKMLALGFFEPVVSMVDLDEVRWGLRSLLESKWGGAVTELFEEPEVTVTSLFGTHYKYRYGR